MGIWERIGYGWARHIQGKPAGEAREQARRCEDTCNKVVVAAAVSAVTGGVGGAAVLGTTQVTVGVQVLTAGNVGICAGVGSACGTATVAHKGPGNLTMKEVLKTGAVAGAIGGAVAGSAISVYAVVTSGTPEAAGLPGAFIPNEDKKPKPGPKDDDDENEKPDGKQQSETPPPKQESPPPKQDSSPPKNESPCPPKHESPFPPKNVFPPLTKHESPPPPKQESEKSQKDNLTNEKRQRTSEWVDLQQEKYKRDGHSRYHTMEFVDGKMVWSENISPPKQRPRNKEEPRPKQVPTYPTYGWTTPQPTLTKEQSEQMKKGAETAFKDYVAPCATGAATSCFKEMKKNGKMPIKSSPQVLGAQMGYAAVQGCVAGIVANHAAKKMGADTRSPVDLLTKSDPVY